MTQRWLTVSILFSLCSVSVQMEDEFVTGVSQNYNERVNSKFQQQILAFYKAELAYKAYATYFQRADVSLPGFGQVFEKASKRANEHAHNMTSYVNLRGGVVHYTIVQLKVACSRISNALTEFAVTVPFRTPSKSYPARTKPHICNFQLMDKKKEPKKYTKVPKKSNMFGFLWTEKKASQDDVGIDEMKREDWPQGLFGLEDAVSMEKSISADLYDLVEAATSFEDPHTRHTLEEYLGNQVNAIVDLTQHVSRLRQYLDDDSYILGEYLLDMELDNH